MSGPPPIPSKANIQETTSYEGEETSDAPAAENSLLRFLKKVASAIDWLMGVTALIFALAFLSVIPILNFLSLGYLIEVSGRIARTGKFRSGFIGIRKASKLGSLVAGTWLVLLPIRFISGMWKDAELIEPGSQSADGWRILLIVATVIGAVHIAWAMIRGGRLRHFFWPAPIRFFKWLGTGGKFTQVRNGLFHYVRELRLPYYFWLGFRGFVGAVIWLALPVLVLFGAAQISNPVIAGLLSFVGGVLLMIAVSYVPFMQAHFGRERRFEAVFEVGVVRDIFRRAPVAFWLSLFITLLFALPLYLLKIELPPKDLVWVPAVVFVIFIFPARLLVGWALARGLKRQESRHWFFRWGSRLAVIPIVAAYALIVWFTQYLTFNGTWSLVEQHAFLVPAPMLGM